MKKLLSILGAIGLTATSTTSLITCKTPKSDNNSENGGNKPEPTPEPQKPPIGNNWKLITDITREGNSDKTYIGIFGNKPYVNITTWKGIEGEGLWHLYQYKAIYRWDSNGNPQTPQIDKNTGKITDWKG